MVGEFAGRSIIVTGAASGIGLAIARRFVRGGASVLMTDVDEKRLEAEVAAIAEESFPGRCQAFVGDLREKLTMTNLVAATIDAYDGLDVLVNASRRVVPSDPLNPEADGLETMLTENVLGTMRLSQIVARRMIALGQEEEPEPADRVILNMSSVQAHHANPKLLAFSVGCAAVEQLTRGLAIALAPHRIRVNAISVGALPGQIDEVMPGIDDLPGAVADVTPLGRAGRPEDFVSAALFLASPEASFVTGQIVCIDGGRNLVDPLTLWHP